MTSYKDKKTLEKLYWVKDMSMSQIAEKYNVDSSTIYYWLNKFDIKTRRYGSDEWKKKIGKSNSDNFHAKCDYCGKKYKTRKSHYKKKERHYCSRECYSKDIKENWGLEEMNAYQGVRKPGQPKWEAYSKPYRKNNPDRIAHLKARRYANKKGAEGSHTLEEWETLKEKYNYKCAHCGQKKKLTKDHIVPLSKGGADYISNIQPLCRSCNSKKWAFEPNKYENPELIENEE